MTPVRPSPRHWPGGLIGTYALHLMQTAPIYGGELTRRIEASTRGAWRPGAGAVYPILQGLVARGDAALVMQGRRKTYRITPQGRGRLRLVRARLRSGGSRFAELRGLILDMASPKDRVELLEVHLTRAIESVVLAVGPSEDLLTSGQKRRLRRRAKAILQQGMAKVAPFTAPGRRR
ncbi:MAG: PadR family transcriptional regulator [Thermoplasmata archaeon]